MADFSDSVIKLAVELIKHRLEATFGDGALNAAAEVLTDVVGKNATEKLGNFLAGGQRTEQLLDAFAEADRRFAGVIADEDLHQAINSQPLSGLPRLTRLAERLPSTLDDEGLLQTIRDQFEEDWGERLSNAQLDRAAYVYRDCLDTCLAAKCEQLLPAVYRKLERIEKLAARIGEDTSQIKRDTKQILEAQSQMESGIQRLLQDRFRISAEYPIQNIGFPEPDSIPLPAFPFLRQDQLVQDLHKSMHSHPWLAFVDGPGKGKSQLALSIAQRFELIKWISLRDKGALTYNHFRAQLALWWVQISGDGSIWSEYRVGLPLESITAHLGQMLGANALLIIDDLPDPIRNETFYRQMEAPIYMLVSHGVRVVTTGQRPLPPFVRNRFQSSIVEESCPSFSTDGIAELLKIAGAPVSFYTQDISVWIAAVTKGHPALVAATIKWLQQSNWKHSPDIFNALISGEPVVETLEYSRRQLLHPLDASHKEMLFRLSIVGESFTRELALEIGNVRPRVSNPGEALDFLIGPWLERLENQMLSVTPLLSYSGKENLNFRTQQAIHRLMFRQLTHGKTIDISKANNVLLHLWQARDYSHFGYVLLQLLLSVKSEEQAKYINWATGYLVGVAWPEEIDLGLRILIRAGQLRVASLGKSRVTRLNQDLNDLLNQADPSKDFLAILGAHIYTGIISRDLPVEITIPRSFALLRLMHSNRTRLAGIFGEDLLVNLAALIWGQGTRATGIEQVILFLNEMTNLSREERAFLFADGAFALEASSYIMDLVWLSEASKPVSDQDWNNILARLNAIQDLPIVQEDVALRVACGRARAVVLADQKKKVNDAIAVLESFSSVSLPDAVFFLNYSKGCIASDGGLVDKAIIYFTEADNSPGEKFPYYRIDNTRRLAIERGRHADWTQARDTCVASIDKFRKISDKNLRNLLRWDEAEMLGELALIHWNLGHWKKACGTLYGFINQLVIEQDDVTQPRYREAFNKAGHSLGWFLSIAQTGNPPATTSDGEIYAPVSSGLFGIRRESLGHHMPLQGFSKATMLLQYARLAFQVGNQRTSWATGSKCLIQHRAENLEHRPALGMIFSDMSILEAVYGSAPLALEYASNAIMFWAATRSRFSQAANDSSKLDLPLDLSNIPDDDLKVAEKHALYLLFTPIFLGLLGLGSPLAVIDRKLENLERLVGENSPIFLHSHEWVNVFHQFRLMAGYDPHRSNLAPGFEAFEDKSIFEILRLIVTSTRDKLNLDGVLARQLRALTGILQYDSLCRSMLPGCGRVLYIYWSRISRTQRFTLHDPQLYEEEMKRISPDLGGKTILKITMATSRALNLRIPEDMLSQLEKLRSL